MGYPVVLRLFFCKGAKIMFDVTVIGAGVVGGMIARELKKYDLSVCILEKENDVSLGASKANSGIVHAGFDAENGTLKAKLNVRGSELMPSVTAELGVHYKNNGSIVVAFDDEEVKTLLQLYDRGVKNGVKGLEIIEKDRIKELEPNISDKAVKALLAPTGGIVCPYMLTVAAVGNAMDNGAVLKTGFEVISITENGNGYRVSSKTEAVDTACVINAAGAYADKIAELAGCCDFTISARKGEYLLLDRECGDTVSHTVFRVPTKMGKGILVSPTVDGNLLVGPTAVNTPDREDVSTTAEGLKWLNASASSFVDNISFKSVITSFSGLRAVGDTGDFIIKMAKNNFVNVAGIESPGLSASPAIAEYVVELLKNSGMKMNKNPDFTPNRRLFRAKESKYYKMICRCETVSEGDILTAIHSNPPAKDVDGVKRRTRAGMGRCQGGFCLPYVAEILAHEYDTDILNITKSGGKSNLLCGRVKELL